MKIALVHKMYGINSSFYASKNIFVKLRIFPLPDFNKHKQGAWSYLTMYRVSKIN